MRPFVVGLDFRRSSLPQRQMLMHLPHNPFPPGCAEAMWLVTPERVELHGTAADPVAPLMAWQEASGGAFGLPDPYLWWDRDAQVWLAQVTAGGQSLLPGDPRPLEDIRVAARRAAAFGGLGPGLGERLMLAQGVARRVRQETGLAAYPARLALQIVALAERIFESWPQCRLLVMGEAAEPLLPALVQAGPASVAVLAQDEGMARRHGAEWLTPEPLPQTLARGDILITALGLGRPVIAAADLKQALKQRRRRPILLIDLSQPGDCESEVAGLEDVFLYTSADLAGLAAVAGFAPDRLIRDAESLITRLLTAAARQPALVTALDFWAESHRQAALAANPGDATAATADMLNRLLSRPRAALLDGGGGLDVAVQRLFGLSVTLDEDEER